MSQNIETAIKCPSWCTFDHSGGETIYHILDLVKAGSHSVGIVEAIDDGSWTVPVPVGVLASLWLGGNSVDHDMTAVECRGVALALLNAADKLDEINAEVSA